MSDVNNRKRVRESDDSEERSPKTESRDRSNKELVNWCGNVEQWATNTAAFLRSDAIRDRMYPRRNTHVKSIFSTWAHRVPDKHSSWITTSHTRVPPVQASRQTWSLGCIGRIPQTVNLRSPET